MVPSGFQHVTGLGNFPSDWLVKPADELTSKITKGTTPSKTEIVEDSIIPFLRVNNLGFAGVLNASSTMLFVTQAAHEGFLARSVAYPGDILMNIVGPPLGKISMLDRQYDEYNMNQAIVIYRTESEKVDQYYFLKFLGSELAQQWLQSRSKKTSGQQNLTIQLCKELPVPIPPLPEQRKIALILSTWDKAISTTEGLIDNSKQQKKGLMQQLLTGNLRLLSDSGERFEGEWEEFKLGTIFKERVETGFHSLPLISITSTGGVISRDDVGRKDTSNSDKSKYRRICKNDIGYNTMRMWQGVSGLSNMEGIVSPAYTILKPNDLVCPKFASYLFKLPQLIHIFRRRSQGLVSDTWNLKYPHFAKIKWIFPPEKEQIKIAAVLINADKEIELLKHQLADLKQEKKALMQQLLTGKRRVKVEHGVAA
jgi:type I restriction enzyme S subunit